MERNIIQQDEYNFDIDTVVYYNVTRYRLSLEEGIVLRHLLLLVQKLHTRQITLHQLYIELGDSIPLQAGKLTLMQIIYRLRVKTVYRIYLTKDYVILVDKSLFTYEKITPQLGSRTLI